MTLAGLAALLSTKKCFSLAHFNVRVSCFNNTSCIAHHKSIADRVFIPRATFKLQIQTSSAHNMPAESSTSLRFVKLTSNAFCPSKGSDKAAGFDLKSAYEYTIQPRSKEMIKTDLQIMLPEGCYGRIAPRSGLAWKNGIDVGAGVVDEDYRGDLRVILFNHSDNPFSIQPGDRIAQLICERIYYPQLLEVKELNETSRGCGGFGSTGKN